MKIAVDFDGTIVEHAYPKIGKEMAFAFATLKELKKQGHDIVLWTYRHGKELDEAVEFCHANGLDFFAINNSDPEERFDPNIMSRKIDADIFIDDRNVGGFLGWSQIWQMLNPHLYEGGGPIINPKEHMNKASSNSIITKIKSLWRETGPGL